MHWGRRFDQHRRVTLPPLDAIASPPPIDDAPPEPRFADPVAAPVAEEAIEASADMTATELAWPTAAEPPAGAYPLQAYDRFRRDVPILPPPGVSPALSPGALAILIDASVAAPFLLRATLRSLQDQSVRAWRALVVGLAALRDHPVGGFADTDPRIAFITAVELPETIEHVALMTAGTVLDPEALAWLLFAAHRIGAPVVTCDYDDGVADPARGTIHAAPQLYGFVDRLTLIAGPTPALILADAGLIRGTAHPVGEREGSGEGVRRAVLTRAIAAGPVPHVPRVLATRLHLPPAARDGRASGDDRIPGRLGPISDPAPIDRAPPPRAERIAIVIPTRDAAGLLSRAIDSLRRTARDPARLDIVVVDNRSADEETRRLLDRLASAQTARTVPFDAPFNYSLMCNRGAAASDAPVIVFANNDIEMIGDGWDDRLLDLLVQPAVAAVGARLLYPDGTIQHAGIAFGFGPNGAEHEGRGRDAEDEGPGRRFVTTHAVAAVTGAFLAVRRVDFDGVGGFDADRLMVGHSDVDLCLRLRERGGAVVYCPAIEALHHEGATRGRNETRAAIAWDEGERADLIDRWGEALGRDPSISPYWVRGGQPFDHLAAPPPSTIVAHIDLTAQANPWHPARRDPSAYRAGGFADHEPATLA